MMETKKTKRADLENKKGIFLQIGFVIVLGLVLGAFEYGTSNLSNESFIPTTNIDEDYEIDQIIRTERYEPPAEAPMEMMPELNVVEDDIEIEDEFISIDVEGGNDLEIPVIEMTDEPPVDDNIFYIVSDPPVFKNGTFINFIHSKLKYPTIAIDNGIEGTVYVSFVINQKGNLVNAKITRGVHPCLNDEALRVIRLSPKWKPGEQMGRKVKVAFTIPVRFDLHNN